SYFLYMLDQDQLAAARFPVGELHKDELRRIARQAGLPTAAKKDSTGICFIGERKFRDFLARYLPAQPGPVVTPEGETLGEHQGLMYYTLGQRQGLGIGGVRDAGEAPWFVVAKDLERNRLIVGQGHDHPLLFQPALLARQAHWVSEATPEWPLACTAKIRYRQPDQACTVMTRDADTLEVNFAQPQRAITPGQSIVFYSGQECLGGAIIEQSIDDPEPR
ncbi:MAG TPA: tRNA 2-thiouridine(34) synthase MnmA, partial [Thioalkalivibrio sp.]|nr:tRNA 2-thiouridine(34) synthase MnmA [Thioalkalivibrio sp.]